jgi:alkylhydroperoxidase family enzyme
MSHFPIHSIHSAPEASKAPLRALEEVFGFVPNLARAMAESPVLIKGFIGLFQNVHAGSFSEAEIQVLLLTNAVTNDSRWPVAFHTHLALHHGISPEDAAAIRVGLLPSDAKHAALSSVAKQLIERRGHLEPAHLQVFLDAGFTREQVLEVILVVSASTITNYVRTVAQPPLEEIFQQHAWTGS